MYKYLIIFGLLLVWQLSKAQNIQGKVTDKQGNAIVGVAIFPKGQTQLATFTDTSGFFNIHLQHLPHRLVFRGVGFRSDTLFIQRSEFITQTLEENAEVLNEVVVKADAEIIDKLSVQSAEILTSKSLAKAACCNLGEAFETNASVNVSYADALTGARQINMMGLSGAYIQNNLENLPNIRSMALPYGLSYVPGTWIQSIDLAKGVGSVVNGFENIGGTINVELKEPDLGEKVHINAYLNSFGRIEGNLNLRENLNSKWSVGLLSHVSGLNTLMDQNNDGFLDMPKTKQYNFLNRWKYMTEQWMIQLGFQYLKDGRDGGQKAFYQRETPGIFYGFAANTERGMAFAKISRLFPEKPYKGVALILQATHQNSKGNFGTNSFKTIQDSFYANFIYQGIFSNTNHGFKSGLSFYADDSFENYQTIRTDRIELIPGAFFEYTYQNLDKTTLVLGLRSDYHSIYGWQYSPRLHFRQDLGSELIWRVSAGRGFRTPLPFTQAFNFLATSRQLSGSFDDLDQGWSLGTSFQYNWQKWFFDFELYRTLFSNQGQIVADLPGFLIFRSGKANSWSSLFETRFKPNQRLEAKLAFRYTQASQTGVESVGTFRDQMFLPKWRGLLNLAYALPYDKWRFDFTTQWNGKQRIPDLNEPQITKWSPQFLNFYAQISRNFPKFEVYLGGENLSNFKQKNPILGAKEPFGNEFDGGLVWGPVTGILVYSGVRIKIK